MIHELPDISALLAEITYERYLNVVESRLQNVRIELRQLSKDNLNI